MVQKENNGDVQLLIRNAITAIRHDHIARARALLVEVTDRAPANEQAWLWRAAVAESTGVRRFCLERVVTIDPEHPTARRALAAIPNSEEAPGISWRGLGPTFRRAAEFAPYQAPQAGELPGVAWAPVGAAVALRAVYTEPPVGSEEEQPVAAEVPQTARTAVLERFRRTLRPTRRVA